MAIVLPLLLLILFGIIDFGIALNRQIQLTQAAREGARVAAISGQAGPAEARARDVFDGADVTSVSVCDATAGEAEVGLSYVYTPLTPLGALIGTGSFQLTARSVMSCSG